MIAAISVTIFITVMLFSVALIFPILNKRVIVKSRVDRLIAKDDFRSSLVPIPPRWQKLLEELGSRIRITSADLAKYREMISSGGFRTDNVNVFVGGKLLLTLLFPSSYLLFYAVPRGILFTSGSFLVTVCFAISGYLLPTLWLDYRVKKRKRDIIHTLPDVLDLLTVCVESGQSLDAALIKTVENFHSKRNPLTEEISRVILEIRAGRVRSEALNGLAERTMVDDVRSFVNMLHQTERFGTSLGKTLRTYSTSQRIKRKQEAEAQAAKTSIKMMFPLVVFIFPGLLIVVLAPAAIRVAAMFK